MIDDKKIEEAATIASISDTEKGHVKNGYVVSVLADHENGYREGYIEGDIVEYDNKVMVIKEQRDGNHFDLSCHKEGLVYCFVSVEDIAPIPITPEILEKNGWVKDTHLHCLDEMPAEAYEKKDFPLTYFNVTFGKKRIQASHDCLFVRNLKYVSDLQHLLFGLGLNSKMEV